MVHVNLLEVYEGEMVTVGVAGADVVGKLVAARDNDDFTAVQVDSQLANSMPLLSLEGKLTCLTEAQRSEMRAIL